MIVVKPVAINDTNLTSSTIPEPDISAGESEWQARSDGTSTRILIDTTGQISIGSFLGGCYHGQSQQSYMLSPKNINGGLTPTIYRYDDSYNYQGTITPNLDGEDAGYSVKDISNRTSTSSVPDPVNDTYSILLIATGQWKVLAINNGGAAQVRIDRTVNGFINGFCSAFIAAQETYLVVRVDISGNTWIDRYSHNNGSLIGSDQLSEVNDGRSVANSAGFIYVMERGGRVLKFNESTRAFVGVAVTVSTFNDQTVSIYNDVTHFFSCNNTTAGGIIAGTALKWGPDWTPSVVTTPADPPYLLGDRVALSGNHKIYQVVAAETRDNPVDGLALIPPSWAEVGSTNRYAMFDESISSKTVSAGSIVIEIMPDIAISGLAVINMSNISSVNVTMTDPLDGEVYNRDVVVINNIGIVNWFNYLWDDFDIKEEFVLLDLPPYASATTKITLSGGGEIGVGALVIGPTATLGVTNYGTNVQQLDFNLYQEDQFGAIVVVKRPSAKLVNFKNTVQKDQLPYVFSQLEQLRGVNAVWVGDETDENDFTLVYGPHRDNTLNIDSPTACTVPLQIRGLT